MLGLEGEDVSVVALGTERGGCGCGFGVRRGGLCGLIVEIGGG